MSFAEFVSADGKPSPIPQDRVLSWEDGIRYAPHSCMKQLRARVTKAVTMLEYRPNHDGYTQYRLLPNGKMYVGRFDAATNLLTVCLVGEASLVPDHIRLAAAANTADIGERIAIKAGVWGTADEVAGFVRKWASAVKEGAAAQPA